MSTYLIPLKYILTDPDNPVDLTALPEAEAIERIKQTYDYWGSLIDVRIEDGIAIIDLPDEQASKAGAALDKIQQAAKAARVGRYQQALTLYQDALKALPLHTDARRELAMVQMEMRNTAAAKQNLIRVLQLNPKDAWAYLVLGNIYFRYENDFGSAERYYATAVEMAPDDPYILNSYASLLAQRRRDDEARAMYQRAIAAKPDYPNSYAGLAMLANVLGADDEAISYVDALFDLPADADVRSQPLYAEARRIYADVRARRARRNDDAAGAELRAAMEGYTARTGIDIRVRRDPKLNTLAKTEFAWRYSRPYHVFLHQQERPDAYTTAHEFEHVLLEEQLRQLAANRLYATSADAEQRALRAIEKDLRKIRDRNRISPGTMEEHALSMVRGLTNQLFNMPLDLFIESRLYADFPALRDAQFVGLARQMADNVQIVTAPEGRNLIPQRIWQSNIAMNAALALFVDDLYRNRTDYAASYQPSGMLPTGRKLYSLFRKMADDKRPAIEYDLVDAWADELNLRDWYTWVPYQAAEAQGIPAISDEEATAAGHRTAQQTIAMHEGGPTNPDYLASPMVQMSATMFMLDALQRFSKMAPKQIEAVAFEVAVIGMNGINYIAGEETYTLKSIPDKQFSGLHLICLEYAGFQLTHPEIDTKIPLEQAYRDAKTMFDAGMTG